MRFPTEFPGFPVSRLKQRDTTLNSLDFFFEINLIYAHVKLRTKGSNLFWNCSEFRTPNNLFFYCRILRGGSSRYPLGQFLIILQGSRGGQFLIREVQPGFTVYGFGFRVQELGSGFRDGVFSS